ncbi:hypothetical protein Golob_004593, partial [Gossypium lobatum]|nr:hypothetical protein [Gossypium lobatum]
EIPVKYGLHAVYIEESRQRYLVRSEIICHLPFQELIDRSSNEGKMVVSCEVVLFEHWILENNGAQLGSMEELVEFYTC